MEAKMKVTATFAQHMKRNKKIVMSVSRSISWPKLANKIFESEETIKLGMKGYYLKSIELSDICEE